MRAEERKMKERKLVKKKIKIKRKQEWVRQKIERKE